MIRIDTRSMTNTVLDDIVEFLLEPPPAPLTAAERTRQWRARLKAEGRPEPKAVDAAIAEAVSYLLSLVHGAPFKIDAADILETATIILKRDGYKRTPSNNEVIARMKPRDLHAGFDHMPSRNPHPNPMLIRSPAGGGGWSEKELDYMKAKAGKTFSRD